jgi:hypothetical protein
MATDFVYSVADDTLNGVVDVDALIVQIGNAAITVAIDDVLRAADVLTVKFKTDISAGEETTLDGVIAAHDGVGLEPEPQTVHLDQEDPDTGGAAVSPKWAPDGWHQVYHEVEFQTAKLNSIHDKKFDDTDHGYSTIKFYDASDVELTTQGSIDTDCVKTVYDFMPTHDYAIKSGQLAQITSPASAVYVWALAAPGLADTVFSTGGINLEFVGPKTLVGLDGVAATILEYSHPQLGDGAGTNKIRFIARHNAGFQHRIQVIFEYFCP